MTSLGSKQETRNIITLKGSVDIVTEFFEYGINSVLFQRGIYGIEDFKKVYKYNLTLLVTKNEKISEFVQNVLKQLREWMMQHVLQKVVLVITNSKTGEALERWEFNIESDTSVTEESQGKHKDASEIQEEIRAIIRQITASVSFLPLLDEFCSFDLLFHTEKNVETPSEWEVSDPKLIEKGDKLTFRNFSTTIHKITPEVEFKA